MYAYLEKIGGEYLDDFVYSSKQPLIRMGFKIREFDGDDLEDTLLCYPLDLSKDVIIGSVESTIEFFKSCEIKVPRYLGYPEELKKYLGRSIQSIKLKDISIPTFIKPKNEVKLFTGCVVDSDYSLKILKDFSNVTDETEVYSSDVINIVSEYRCFVREGELKGIKNYSGDFKLFPSIEIIEKMISDYTSSNKCYTLDVGINSFGETILIEVNDLWALGSYGFDPSEYTLMCVRRMREIYFNNLNTL